MSTLTDLPASEQEVLGHLRELAPGLAAGAAGRDERAELALDAFRALHQAGLTRAVLPARLGGGGMSHRGLGEAVRLLAEADPSIATVMTMHLGAGVGLAEMTHDTLGDHYAERLLGGHHFANALSEPASGNRFLQPQQEAVRAPGGWTLDGAKRFVSGSEVAEHLLVNALVDGVPTFFGVEPDETVTVVPIWDTLGLRATRSQLLSFEGTLLREDRRGRPPGPGDLLVVPAGLPAISLGIADAALAALAAHARGRAVLGAPLSHQQWVQHAVADVHVRLEAAHALFQRALAVTDAGSPTCLAELSQAKYLANKVAVDVAQLAVRVGGASGFLRSSPIQRHLRDAQAGQLMAYSTEVLATEIGRAVLGVTEEVAPA